MSKYTEGPWQLARADAERCRVDIETVERGNDLPDQGNHIAVAYWGTPTEEANARLMATAPELLAACKQFIRYGTSGKHPGWTRYLTTIAGQKMQQAVAKAEGTQ